MEIKQLRAFLAVANAKSFLAAAETMYITRQAVSKTVTQLEEELGVKLFVRGQSGAELTPAGVYFYPQARTLVADFDRLQREMTQLEQNTRPKLRICMAVGVNTIFTGSQLVSDRLRVSLNKTFPNARLIVYYGAGELNYVTYKVIDGAIEPNNVGRAFDGVNVEIRDGLIFVNSPWHVSGLKTPCTVGDAGRLNDKGELIFEGRGDDFINKGGYKISCARLESVLSTLGGIEQAAVIKIDDRRRGDDFVFVIQSTEPERAVEEIKKALPPIERAGKIIFVDEMPLNDRGKVDRHVLRSKFM